MRSGQDRVDEKYKRKNRKLKLIVRDLTEKIGRELTAKEEWQREKDALLGEIKGLQE